MLKFWVVHMDNSPDSEYEKQYELKRAISRNRTYAKVYVMLYTFTGEFITAEDLRKSPIFICNLGYCHQILNFFNHFGMVRPIKKPGKRQVRYYKLESTLWNEENYEISKETKQK